MKSDSQFKSAVRALHAGEVVGMPTETVYGLAASIRSEAGLKAIFALKERPLFDPLIVHIGSQEQVLEVVSEWPPLAQKLADRFWPGPLTIVLPKRPEISSLITAGLSTVGVRFPRHPMARALIEAAGVPLAAPSANKFGKTSPTLAEHVLSEFGDSSLIILDGGASEVGLESTVVRISGDLTIDLLRPGTITEDDLRGAIVGLVVERKTSQASPGHDLTHYQPKVPLVLLEGESRDLSAEELRSLRDRFGAGASPCVREVLLDVDPLMAARGLYRQLRELPQAGAQFLVAFRSVKQQGGAWDAIWDRLDRARTKV